MGPLGSLVGLALTAVLAAGIDKDDPADECMDRLQIIIYVQNGIITGLCLLLILLIREKPSTPPSKLALTFRENSKQGGLCKDLAKLCKNRNFILTTISFILMWGDFLTLGNVLTPLFGD